MMDAAELSPMQSAAVAPDSRIRLPLPPPARPVAFSDQVLWGPGQPDSCGIRSGVCSFPMLTSPGGSAMSRRRRTMFAVAACLCLAWTVGSLQQGPTAEGNPPDQEKTVRTDVQGD